MGSEESLAHLFLHSEIAQRVWQCFVAIFRLLWRFVSIAQAINIWMPMSFKPSQFEICKANTVGWLLCELWIARCAEMYDDVPMDARKIARKVISRVQIQSLVFTPRKISRMIQRNIIAILGINAKLLPFKHGTWCKWDFPSKGWFKLNIDRSQYIITCGGVIRDDCGNILAAFSNFYGMGSNNLAKFTVLRDGILVFRALGLNQVLVESDLVLVAHAMRQQRIQKWRLEHIYLS